LKSAYIVECTGFEKDAAGNVTIVKCKYIPESKSGSDTSGLSVKGTIHWVSAHHAKHVEIRMYDRLFKVEDPNSEEGDFKSYINENSLNVQNAFVEPALMDAKPEDRFQFIRKGYFFTDKDSTSEKPVFNLTCTLKDSWAKK
jgi:glutaminyl-tRNA synthetase